MLRQLPWALVALFLLLPLTAATWAARSMVVHASEGMVDDEETELETHMLAIQEGLKGLRRSLRKAEEDLAPSLTLLDGLQADSVRCKALIPAKEADLPEAGRANFRKEYRKEMLVFLEQLMLLEKQLLEGDFEGAAATLKKVRAMEDPSHEKFMKDF